MFNPWDSQAFTEGARREGRADEVVAACLTAARKIKSVNIDLPVILSLKHLCSLADVDYLNIRRIASRRYDPYRVFRLKKKGIPGGIAPSHKYRTICIPEAGLLRTQRWIAQNLLNHVPVHSSSYAFAPGSSIVRAAAQHSECKWLLKVDVRRFFESIDEAKVYNIFYSLGYGRLVSFELARICTKLQVFGFSPDNRREIVTAASSLPYDLGKLGHLPQGAPTSPMLANLVMLNFDLRMDRIAGKHEWQYTRYADDVCLSTRDRVSRHQAGCLLFRLKHELESFGLSINESKTRICPPGSRKIVLGLLVDRSEPRLTKEFRNQVETHLYALKSKKIGVEKHRESRGFASVLGMKKHIRGLIAYAIDIDKEVGSNFLNEFNQIDWPA